MHQALDLSTARDRLYGSVMVCPNGCWEWNEGRTRAGYGTVSLGGNHLYTHRLSWMVHNADPIP